MTPARVPALIVLVALSGALAAAIVVITPWSPLGAHALSVKPKPSLDFTPAQIARSRVFHRELRWPSYLSLFIALVVAGVLGLTPLGGRVVAAVARPFGGGWVMRVVVGVIAISLLLRLVALPFDAWTQSIQRRYGISTQSWPGWLSDVARSFGLATGLSVLALLGLYALSRTMPRWWFIPTAVAGATLVIVVSFLYPLVVEPVFNKFHSLGAGQLRSSLLALAEQDHQHVSDVLVADASRRTTAENAYVSGFGATRRIVIYDTLLRRDSPEEVRLVVAHELGHAKYDDVLHGTSVGGLGVAVGVVALYLLLTWSGLLARAGASSAGDPRSLALVLFLASLFGLLSAPVQNLVSRHIEARADVHALELTHDATTFVRAQESLSVSNLSTLQPVGIEYVWFFTHPSAPERIAMAREWAQLHGVAVPPPLVTSAAPAR